MVWEVLEAALTYNATRWRPNVLTLRFEEIPRGFDGAMAGQSNLHHSEAQALLSSWCCTQLSAFGEKKGLVPYLLPPLEGSGWRGAPALKWVARALS